MPGAASRFSPEFRLGSGLAAGDGGGLSPYGTRMYPKIAYQVEQVKAVVSEASPLFARDLLREEPRTGEESVHDENGGPRGAEGEGGEPGLLAKGMHVAEKVKVISSKFRSLLLKTEPHKAERLQAVSWHRRKLWLAFIGSDDQVLVQDFEDPGSREPVTLVHKESQKGVEAVEWRPNAGATLSVACRGGIVIWTASYPGNIAPVRTGNPAFTGTLPSASGARWVVVDFLKGNSRMPVTCLSWSPCGRLLASSSLQDSSFTVWDVSLGKGTPLRRGLGGVSLLKWALNGDYLMSSKASGAFHLWETYSWTSQPWTTSQGSLINAAWSPDGRVLLAAFDQSPTLAAFHFAARPPSLDVHWLPLDLPGLHSITGGFCNIDKIVWNSTGKQLAVSCSAGEAQASSGLVAIYEVRQSPIVSVSLLGFVSAPEGGVRPVAFAFHESKKPKQGMLLSVCWSNGFCCIYSLVFGSQPAT